MSGRKSRNKGKRWEQDVARTMREIFGDQVRRGWQSREGSDAPDVDGVPRFWIECKRQIRTNIKAALLQAKNEGGDTHRLALAICRDDPKPGSGSTESRSYAGMYYEDFKQLLILIASRDKYAQDAADLLEIVNQHVGTVTRDPETGRLKI